MKKHVHVVTLVHMLSICTCLYYIYFITIYSVVCTLITQLKVKT